jgi:hypothetical protein
MACAQTCVWSRDLHLPLPPLRRPMLVFRPVIQVAAGRVFDIRQHGTAHGAVAAQTVGGEALRFALQALLQALEEPLGGSHSGSFG